MAQILFLQLFINCQFSNINNIRSYLLHYYSFSQLLTWLLLLFIYLFTLFNPSPQLSSGRKLLFTKLDSLEIFWKFCIKAFSFLLLSTRILFHLLFYFGIQISTATTTAAATIKLQLDYYFIFIVRLLFLSFGHLPYLFIISPKILLRWFKLYIKIFPKTFQSDFFFISFHFSLVSLIFVEISLIKLFYSIPFGLTYYLIATSLFSYPVQIILLPHFHFINININSYIWVHILILSTVMLTIILQIIQVRITISSNNSKKI